MDPQTASLRLKELGFKAPPKPKDLLTWERGLLETEIAHGQPLRALTAWRRASAHIATMCASTLTPTAYAERYQVSKSRLSVYARVAVLPKPVDDDSVLAVLCWFDKGAPPSKSDTLPNLRAKLAAGLLKQRTPGVRQSDHKRLSDLLSKITARKANPDKEGWFAPGDRDGIVRFVAQRLFGSTATVAVTVPQVSKKTRTGTHGLFG